MGDEDTWRGGKPGRAWPKLAGYEVTAEIGRGGFASVYEAIQSAVGRRVALKVLSSAAVDEAMERRFRSEARAIGELSWHPNVVGLFDAGFTDEGRPYLVMELVPGGSLADRVRRDGALPPIDVVRAGRDMANALAAAHQAGVVHRDIKPDNMLVDRDGRVLLSDFGIATIQDSTRSATGTFSGTFNYCAPEVHHGRRAGPEADIFSLGTSLYTLASGRLAFSNGTEDAPSAVILRVVSEDPAPLPADVPAALAVVIARAMSKEPGDRYPSAVALLDALAEIGVDQGPMGPRSSPSLEQHPEASTTLATRVARPSPAEGLDAPTVIRSDALLPDERATTLSGAEAPTVVRGAGSVALRASDPTVVVGAPALRQREVPGPPTPDQRSPEPNDAGSGIQLSDRRRWALLAGAVAAVAMVVVAGMVWSNRTGGANSAASDPPTESKSSSSAPAPTNPTIANAKTIWPHDLVGIASDADQIWLGNQGADGNGFSSKIDPETFSLGARADGFGGFALALGGGSLWMGHQSPNQVLQVDSSTGRTVHTVTMPGFVATLTYSDGVLWATGQTETESDDDRVWRIDAQTFKVTEVNLPGSGVHIWSRAGVGEGAVWIPGTTHWDRKSNGGDDVLWKIDPSSGEVIDSISVPTGYVAVGGSAVWVASGDALRQLDPRTGKVLHTTLIQGDILGAVTYGEHAVWGVDNHATVYRFDPVSGAITDEVGKQHGDWSGEITTGVGAVWVADGIKGTLTKVKP